MKPPFSVWIAEAYDHNYMPFIFKKKPRTERSVDGLRLMLWDQDKFIRIRWLRNYKLRNL